jgi:hypothetical protein
VYFASDRGVYFWAEGNRWRTGAALPAHITVDESHGVSIELETDKPYRQHASVSHMRTRGSH